MTAYQIIIALFGAETVCIAGMVMCFMAGIVLGNKLTVVMER